jgi:hypothetical protein
MKTHMFGGTPEGISHYVSVMPTLPWDRRNNENINRRWNENAREADGPFLGLYVYLEQPTFPGWENVPAQIGLRFRNEEEMTRFIVETQSMMDRIAVITAETDVNLSSVAEWLARAKTFKESWGVHRILPQLKWSIRYIQSAFTFERVLRDDE